MKNFARVMGLPFGCAGANTHPKSGKLPPSPPEISLSNRLTRERYYRGYEIATYDGNVDFRFSEKFYVRSLKNSCKVVDLLAQKLSNDMTLN